MVALVFGGKLGRVWLSDFDYLRFAGAEPATGLCVYLGGRVCSVTAGGMVVVSGADHRRSARRPHFHRCGIGDAAARSRVNFGLRDRLSLERADGEGDRGQEQGCAGQAKGQNSAIARCRPSPGRSLQEHSPKATGRINYVGSSGMAK